MASADEKARWNQLWYRNNKEQVVDVLRRRGYAVREIAQITGFTVFRVVISIEATIEHEAYIDGRIRDAGMVNSNEPVVNSNEPVVLVSSEPRARLTRQWLREMQDAIEEYDRSPPRAWAPAEEAGLLDRAGQVTMAELVLEYKRSSADLRAKRNELSGLAPPPPTPPPTFAQTLCRFVGRCVSR